MSVAGLLGVVCIVIGFIAGIIDDKILFGPLEWFVAAIAFNTLPLVFTVGKKSP